MSRLEFSGAVYATDLELSERVFINVNAGVASMATMGLINAEALIFSLGIADT